MRRIRSLHSFCGMTYSASRNVFCLRVIHFFINGGSSMPSMTTSSWLSASPPPPPIPPGIMKLWLIRLIRS